MEGNVGIITETSARTEGIMAFIIWAIVALIFVFVGIYAWNAKEPVGFFTFQKPPEVSDVKGYNHAVAKLWFAFATVMVLLGLPLLTGQNSPYVIISVFGMMFGVIGMIVAYLKVEKKYKRRNHHE